MFRGLAVSGCLTFSVLVGTAAYGQDLVYQPRNPSFGGEPFYSSHLLGIAQFDRPDPPQGDDPFARDRGDTQTDFFVRQLESRILSRLSSDITDAIFGPDADPSGVFQFQDTTIAFETALDGTIRIDITDTLEGGTTTIEVPAFLTQAQ